MFGSICLGPVTLSDRQPMFLPSTHTYRAILVAWILLGVVIFGILLRVSAPYGRFARSGWGPGLPVSLNWMLMESPALLVFAALFFTADELTGVRWSYFALWTVHYTYRSVIYPCLINSHHHVPVTITLSGAAFNLINAWLQGVWLFHLTQPQDPAWFLDPRFVTGTLLFVGGLFVHVRADAHLRSLRKTMGPGYHIPHRGLFRRISCPNYLGELSEWTGWAILTWSWPGLAFAIWTAANLVPRALATHRWYQTTIADYPRTRKAIFPGLL